MDQNAATKYLIRKIKTKKMNNDQNETRESKSSIDFCTTIFDVPGQQVINSYKCNEKKFSSADMWDIQKRRREFNRRTSNFVIN